MLCVFQQVELAGRVSIAKAQLLDLTITGPAENEGNKVKTRELDLLQTHIRRELQIKGMGFEKLTAEFLQVDGPMVLEDVAIEQEASLEHARFLTLHLDGVKWPGNPGERERVRLEGMTYEHLSATGGEEPWREEILAWIDDSVYSAQPYTQLESSFVADGYPERADEVYVRLRKRQRQEFAGRVGQAGDWLLEKLVRYGRSPERAFYLSAVVVFLGMLLFRRRKDVQPQDPKDEGRRYNPLWYSLDLFLPFIDLQAADVWMPSEHSWVRRHYARVHTILGWILIPIGLAAVTGIIK